MSLAELRIENLRCIESAVLEFSPELNLIAGENGAGKTSILEAIFLLGPRPFVPDAEQREAYPLPPAQAHRIRPYATIRPPSRPESKSPRTAARAPGSTARTATSLLELSGVLPVQAIDPEIHKLVDQGPERRRRWLDWLVFHVEPSFGLHWARYNRALKQRNAALRAGAAEISAWDARADPERRSRSPKPRQRALEPPGSVP